MPTSILSGNVYHQLHIYNVGITSYRMQRDGSVTMVAHLITNLCVVISLANPRCMFRAPANFSRKWSAPFFGYYNSNIHIDIAAIAQWPTY